MSWAVMSIKLEIESTMMNILMSDEYALQVGCEMEEKEEFWRELDKAVESVPKKGRGVIGANFSGHVGEGNRDDGQV